MKIAPSNSNLGCTSCKKALSDDFSAKLNVSTSDAKKKKSSKVVSIVSAARQDLTSSKKSKLF